MQERLILKYMFLNTCNYLHPRKAGMKWQNQKEKRFVHRISCGKKDICVFLVTLSSVLNLVLMAMQSARHEEPYSECECRYAWILLRVCVFVCVCVHILCFILTSDLQKKILKLWLYLYWSYIIINPVLQQDTHAGVVYCVNSCLREALQDQLKDSSDIMTIIWSPKEGISSISKFCI